MKYRKHKNKPKSKIVKEAVGTVRLDNDEIITTCANSDVTNALNFQIHPDVAQKTPSIPSVRRRENYREFKARNSREKNSPPNSSSPPKTDDQTFSQITQSAHHQPPNRRKKSSTYMHSTKTSQSVFPECHAINTINPILEYNSSSSSDFCNSVRDNELPRQMEKPTHVHNYVNPQELQLTAIEHRDTFKKPHMGSISRAPGQTKHYQRLSLENTQQQEQHENINYQSSHNSHLLKRFFETHKVRHPHSPDIEFKHFTDSQIMEPVRNPQSTPSDLSSGYYEQTMHKPQQSYTTRMRHDAETERLAGYIDSGDVGESMSAYTSHRGRHLVTQSSSESECKTDNDDSCYSTQHMDIVGSSSNDESSAHHFSRVRLKGNRSSAHEKLLTINEPQMRGDGHRHKIPSSVSVKSTTTSTSSHSILNSNYVNKEVMPAVVKCAAGDERKALISQLLDCNAHLDITSVYLAVQAYAVDSVTTECLYTISDAIVNKLVRWTHNLPFYNEIPMSIHSLLLTQKWHEMLVLVTTAHRSMNKDNNDISTYQSIYNNNKLKVEMYLKRLSGGNEMDLHSIRVKEIIGSLTKLIFNFIQLEIKPEEYVCLQVLLLLHLSKYLLVQT